VATHLRHPAFDDDQYVSELLAKDAAQRDGTVATYVITGAVIALCLMVFVCWQVVLRTL